MPGINLNQPLLGAGAAAKNDWASASARTALDFTAQAEFKRGVNVTIGISALAQADAGLAQFVAPRCEAMPSRKRRRACRCSSR